jgi:hypothetical protein
MTCRHCDTEIAAKALICYRCGKATSDPRVTPPDQVSVFAGRRRSRWPIVLGVVVVAVLAAAWFFIR